VADLPDYVEIFLALAVNGLIAREVQNDVHGFADFFADAIEVDIRRSNTGSRRPTRQGLICRL
jgi:hypothetical protein